MTKLTPSVYTNARRNPHRTKGFTLTELIVSISILIITLGLSTPTFAEMIERHNMAQQTDELLASLRFARAQAVNQNLDVYVCRAISSQQCAASTARWADWSDGWLIFADMNNSRTFDSNDILLRQHYDTSRPFLLTINQAGRLRFRYNGSSRNLGFYFCSDGRTGTIKNRKVTLLYTGRTRIQTLTEKQLPKACKIHTNGA